MAFHMQRPHLAGGLVVKVADGVLHPVLVVAGGEVLARMRSPGLLALLRAVDGHRAVYQQVLQLHRLPNQAAHFLGF